MAVNSDAQLWGPYKELERIVHAAVHRRQADAIHDLEVALKRHKPDFISLLKNPPKNKEYRNAVKSSNVDGLPIKGEQTKQTFPTQFIEEALIISDLLDMSEIAAVELLMAGDRKQAEFPGLTRGLIAVLLYFDGQKSLVNALRTLLQCREGRTWTMELTPELSKMVADYTTELINKDKLVNKILDILTDMDWDDQLGKLQNARAVGPSKHRKQLQDIFQEIKLILADCLFCLASQHPLEKDDTLRLISYLKKSSKINPHGQLDLVTLCLIMALLYCFDVSVLDDDNNTEYIRRLPLITDNTYTADVHKEITAEGTWSVPGVQGVAQLSWGLSLRQLSQYQIPTGVNEYCEEDEAVISLATDNNVFHFLDNCVVAVDNFHQEEFYLRKIHGLITDFIFFMPLKVKELRNRSDEAARIAMSQSYIENPDQLVSASRGFEYLLQLIGHIYGQDPLGLNLSVEFWYHQETNIHESVYHYRPPQRQVSLNKFVRLAGDLLPPSLYVPYIDMLTGLASNNRSALLCFELLKTNGLGAGGHSSSISWNHIFASLNQYYSNLRIEMPTSSEVSQRVHHIRGITPKELEGLIAVLRLTEVVAEQNENCRIAFCENQQWSMIMCLFGLLACSIPPTLKAQILLTLSALSKTADIAANLWQILESSQVIPTTHTGAAKQPGGLQIELDEVESRNEEYPMILGFLDLMNSLTDIPVPAGLGAGLRSPGFDPYLNFIRDDIFLKFDSRAYKDPAEMWKVATATLEIFVKLLKSHEVRPEDFVEEIVELQSGGTVSVNKPPGHTLIIHMLNDSGLLRKILKVLDVVVKDFESYTSSAAKKHMEKASLLCLQMIEYTLDKSDLFIDTCREMGVSVMVCPMDRLLRGTNPRTGKPDHLINITKYITFNAVLPYHAMSAMKILFRVSRAAGIQADLVKMFIADETTKCELLNGFVECLEVDDPETPMDRIIYLDEEKDEDSTLSGVRNLTRQYLLHTLVYSLEQPAPNLAHYLLGYDLNKPVNKTNLQDPGILGSQKTCLHSMLTILDNGIGTPSGPLALQETPKLSELMYKLIYMLAANKDTSAPTLRYLRTSYDFLFRHLQHVPFNTRAGPIATNHQSWLLKTVAVELRMTTLNRQRSHTQRLLKLLLDDHIDEAEQVGQPGIDETVDTGFDRFSDTSYLQTSFLSQTTRQFQGRQTRRKILNLLDSVEFTQAYPARLTLEFFDPALIEQVILKAETKTEDNTIYCNVKVMRSILMNELSNVQSNVMVANRPRILEEVNNILENIVSRNKVRQNLAIKQQSYDAWRQVTEILLTACPEDLIPRDIRQKVLFELLQELLNKVAEENSIGELTSPVSGTLLTLFANLKQCFVSEQSQLNQTTMSRFSSVLEEPSEQATPWGQSSGSRTLFATSLQLVLKGLIDHIMHSSGGQQRVRANLYGALLYYLQIAQKPKTQKEATPEGVGERLLASTDSEFDQLTKDNVATILSYGDNFMDTVCRDACDGHDVGRMLALSVLDIILSMDKFQQWLTFMTSKGYLQHLVDSFVHDDNQLQSLLGANPQLRILYIYESKMGLLTRISESTAGAMALLRAGIMTRLAQCNYFDMRPEPARLPVEIGMEQDGFEPSPLARYRQLLFACLKLCLAILTSCGIENQDAGNQILQFIFAHGEIFHNILRDRQPPQDLQALKELSLTTAVIARAQSRGIPDAEFNDYDTTAIEIRAQKTRIERQMIALFPKYCLSEKLNKQWRNLETQQLHEGRDIRAELQLTYLEIASNVTSYCRAVISTSGLAAQYCRVLFSPSLEEAMSRDLRNNEEFSVSSATMTPSLGVIVYQLRQCASNFMYVYDSHQQHQRKLHGTLSNDDLKEYSGVPMTEKMGSHQRQQLAKKRLSQIVNDKLREMQQLSYILENCVFILWRHLEFYLIHCVPTDQQPSMYQVQVRRQQQMRRLQELTGASQSMLESQSQWSPELDESTRAVTRDDITSLKSNLGSAVNESLLKKLQEINQSFCKNRTHYGFVEALIRRLRRLLRQHT